MDLNLVLLILCLVIHSPNSFAAFRNDYGSQDISSEITIKNFSFSGKNNHGKSYKISASYGNKNINNIYSLKNFHGYGSFRDSEIQAISESAIFDNNKKSVHLFGDLSIKYDDLSIKSSEIILDLNKYIVTSDKPTVLTGKNFSIYSGAILFDENQRMRFFNNIKVNYNLDISGISLKLYAQEMLLNSAFTKISLNHQVRIIWQDNILATDNIEIIFDKKIKNLSINNLSKINIPKKLKLLYKDSLIIADSAVYFKSNNNLILYQAIINKNNLITKSAKFTILLNSL